MPTFTYAVVSFSLTSQVFVTLLMRSLELAFGSSIELIGCQKPSRYMAERVVADDAVRAAEEVGVGDAGADIAPARPRGKYCR